MDHLYLLMAALAEYGLFRRPVEQAEVAAAAVAAVPLVVAALVAAKEAMEVLTAAEEAAPELNCRITLEAVAEMVEHTAAMAEQGD